MNELSNTRHAITPPLIVNLAPTGMLPAREQTPHVPLDPDEIATDCAQCVAAGASMLHLHARAADGQPSTDPGLVHALVTAVRAQAPGAIVVTTTSGRIAPEIEKRSACLFLNDAAQPDMASLTLGSFNFARNSSINPPATITRLAEIMRDRGIKPELEAFDLGMINVARILIDKGLLAPPFYFNLMLGNPATAQASLLHLGAMVADLPAQSIWSVGGIGRYQARANAIGIALGDGVRTGLEDNIWLDDARTTLASNHALVARIVAQAQALGRPIATPATVRDRLGLRPRS